MNGQIRYSTSRLERYQEKQRNMGPRRYITGFDGLRTLAVLGVIIYHLMPSALPGGYLGVPIFFVVSGYLITDILLQDWSVGGSVRIMRFYGHRMRRLYPAFVTMLLGTTAYIMLFQRSLLINIRATVLTNVLYVYNWFEIGHGQSYFDRFSGESPFTHLWSLSIEGQYYLLWPLIIGVLMLIFKKRSRVFWFMIILAGISALSMAVLYNPINTNRVYYGTDTRLFAILLGSGLAFVWPSRELSTNLGRANQITLDVVGGSALIGIVWAFFQMSGQSRWTYQGGMFLFTLLSTVLVAIVAHPASHVNQLLTNPIFKYVGQRSYGIYLYQFPVMVFYEMKIQNVGDHPVVNSLVEVVIILLIAELSYRLIEEPLRHVSRVPKLTKGTLGLVAFSTALLVTTAIAFVQQPSQASAHKQTTLQKNIKANSKAASKRNIVALKHQHAAKKLATKTKLNQQQKNIVRKYHLTASQLIAMNKTDLTAIGDSVLLDVSTDLQEVIPGTTIQGRVGRQMTEVPAIVKKLKTCGKLAHNVLLNVGTNGTITNEQAEQVVKLIGSDREIYWVTAHVPTQSWQNQVNAQIKKTARQHHNVHVIDWHQQALNQSSWFASDNVHPNETGNRQLTALIVRRIAKFSDD